MKKTQSLTYLDVAVVVDQLVGDIATLPACLINDVNIRLPVPVS